MVGAAARQPTAVLVVSAWYEGAPPRLAARITSTLDVTRPERVVVVVAGEDELVRVVRRWVADVAASAPSGDASVTDA
jgi:hypothetical protein